jgi:hypothetical protein
VPYNNEMKRTKSAIARMARPSPLISVFSGPRRQARVGPRARESGAEQTDLVRQRAHIQFEGSRLTTRSSQQQRPTSQQRRQRARHRASSSRHLTVTNRLASSRSHDPSPRGDGTHHVKPGCEEPENKRMQQTAPRGAAWRTMEAAPRARHSASTGAAADARCWADMRNRRGATLERDE